MAYRQDINGLRAVAVLAVVLFHFQFGDWTSGGFVGVDIFFVISGYLITGVILRGLDEGSFSLAEFYHRRINRILPALFIVFAACVVGSSLLDFQIEAEETARSLFASSLFVSNVLFYFKNDYFNHQSDSNPLLHTWSLSIEEQFYLLFPLLMLATRRWPARTRTPMLAALATASFVWSCWMVETDRAAAFYLMPSRAWELLLGGLLASRATSAPSGRWPSEALSALGFVLVLGSVTLIDTALPFPGAVALAPCLGAACIILGGARTSVGRLLGLAPLRYLGLISYSLYLWHWPVLVFYRRIDDPHGIEKIVLPLVCVALAALSYHVIEQPFRTRRRSDARMAFAVAAGAITVCATVGVGLVLLTSMLHATPAAATSVLSYLRYDMSPKVREGTCFLTERTGGFRGFRPDECLAWDRKRRNVMLLGDSYAAHLWPGLKKTYPTVNVLQATASLCKPTLPAQGERRCEDLLAYVMETFLPNHRPDEIIIAARWRAEDLEGLLHTIAALHAFTDRIVVIGPMVEYEQSLPRLLAREIQSNRVVLAASYQSAVAKEADQTLAAGLVGVSAIYVSLQELLCTPDCQVWASAGKPLQFDFGHLTGAGSKLVALRLGPKLFPASYGARDAGANAPPRSLPVVGRADDVPFQVDMAPKTR